MDTITPTQAANQVALREFTEVLGRFHADLVAWAHRHGFDPGLFRDVGADVDAFVRQARRFVPVDGNHRPN